MFFVGAMVVRIDFVGFEFTQDKCKERYVNDMVTVVEKLVEVDGVRRWERRYFDFLCSDFKTGKNDFQFVRSVFHWLHEHNVLQEATELYLFSDNAGKHFKNKHTFDVIMRNAVEWKIRILWIMYAPNHGMSLCDSHGGILGQKVLFIYLFIYFFTHISS